MNIPAPWFKGIESLIVPACELLIHTSEGSIYHTTRQFEPQTNPVLHYSDSLQSLLVVHLKFLMGSTVSSRTFVASIPPTFLANLCALKSILFSKSRFRRIVMGWIPTVSGNNPQDPIETFFSRLPSPKHHYKAWLEPNYPEKKDPKFDDERTAARLFILDIETHESNDPDYNRLLPHIQTAASTHNPTCQLYEQLGALVLEKGVDVDDHSYKGQHLRYALWMGQGRKDETSPFPVQNVPLTETENYMTPTGPDLKYHLATLSPSYSQQSCTQCKKQGEILSCSACRMPGPGTDTLATVYCSRTCQARHWPEHKARCKDLQQFYRASAMYQQIFDHFLAETYTLQPTEMTEQNGVAMMKDESGECKD